MESYRVIKFDELDELQDGSMTKMKEHSHQHEEPVHLDEEMMKKIFDESEEKQHQQENQFNSVHFRSSSHSFPFTSSFSTSDPFFTSSSSRSSLHQKGPTVNNDKNLHSAIDSMNSMMKTDIFNKDQEFHHHPRFARSASSSTSSVSSDNVLIEALDTMESMMKTTERQTRSVEDDEEDEETDLELEEAVESFESLMKAASDVSHNRSPRSTFQENEEEHLMRELREVYDYLNKASVHIEKDKFKAYKSIQKAKHKLHTIIKVIHSREISSILNKIGSLGSSKTKRSVDDDSQHSSRLVHR